MKPRTKLLLILTPLALVILSPVAFFAIYVAASLGSDQGSPVLAGEWRKELDKYATPEDAVKADPTIQVVKFKNGEWLFGRSQNSHGIWLRGGGTMVMKDSRGEIRAYAGHVCGPRFLSSGWGSREDADLDKFYSDLKECSFVDLKFQ